MVTSNTGGTKNTQKSEENLVKRSISNVESYQQSQDRETFDMRETMRRSVNIDSMMDIQKLAQVDKDSIAEVDRYKDRQRDLARKDDMDGFEKDTKTKSSIIKDAMIGAVAGFSAGQVMNWVAPREELDKMTEIREEYIRMYGTDEDYKKIKDTLYRNIRSIE